MKLPGNLQQLMQQAQKMQEAMQQGIESIQVEASVGGGAVSVRMDGKKNLLDIQIDPEAARDIELLRDLVLSAVRKAANQVDDEIKNRIGDQMGSIGLPPGLF